MNEMERRAILGAAGIGALAALSRAGPLDPPAGAIVPTGRTLDEVYNKMPASVNGTTDGRVLIPGGTSGVSITQPGSYFLAGNVSAATGAVIRIVSPGVTLDLNGFTVLGGTSGVGVQIDATLRTHIHNGTISAGWGIWTPNAVQQLVMTDLLISNCYSRGIWAAGRAAVRRCAVTNTGFGNTTGGQSVGLNAITLAGAGCVVEDTVVNGIVFQGSAMPTIRGIWMGASATPASGNLVRRCTVTSDAPVVGTGIQIDGAAVYRDNTVMNFAVPYSGTGVDGGGNV